ncbi:hypothetical protein JTY60_02240 [symbiont of Argiope bruennichi]|uniref:hypothetical protein n=1 Tax=symbiont of Argiope bruennichi TaxID=2810479 RepID=UPI003DA6321C
MLYLIENISTEYLKSIPNETKDDVIKINKLVEFVENFQQFLVDLKKSYKLVETTDIFNKDYLKNLNQNAEILNKKYQFSTTFFKTSHLYYKFIIIYEKYKNYQEAEFTQQDKLTIKETYNKLLLGSGYFFINELKSLPLIDKENNLLLEYDALLSLNNSEDLKNLKKNIFFKLKKNNFFSANFNLILSKSKILFNYLEANKQLFYEYFLNQTDRMNTFTSILEKNIFLGYSKNFLNFIDYMGNNFQDTHSQQSLENAKKFFWQMNIDDFLNFWSLPDNLEKVKDKLDLTFHLRTTYFFVEKTKKIFQRENIHLFFTFYPLMTKIKELESFILTYTFNQEIDSENSDLLDSFIKIKASLFNPEYLKNIFKQIWQNFCDLLFSEINIDLENYDHSNNFISKKTYDYLKEKKAKLESIVNKFQENIESSDVLKDFLINSKELLQEADLISNIFNDNLLIKKIQTEKYQNFLNYLRKLKEGLDNKNIFNSLDPSTDDWDNKFFETYENLSIKDFLDKKLTKEQILTSLEKEIEKNFFHTSSYTSKIISHNLDFFDNDIKNDQYFYNLFTTTFSNKADSIKRIRSSIQTISHENFLYNKNFFIESYFLFNSELKNCIFETWKRLESKFLNLKKKSLIYWITTKNIEIFSNDYEKNIFLDSNGKIIDNFYDYLLIILKDILQNEEIEKFDFSLINMFQNYLNFSNLNFLKDTDSSDPNKKFNFFSYLEKKIQKIFNEYQDSNLFFENNDAHNPNNFYSFTDIEKYYQDLSIIFPKIKEKKTLSLSEKTNFFNAVTFFLSKNNLTSFINDQEKRSRNFIELTRHSSLFNSISFDWNKKLNIFNYLKDDEFDKYLIDDQEFFDDYYFIENKEFSQNNYYLFKNNLKNYLNYLFLNNKFKNLDYLNGLKEKYLTFEKYLNQKLKNFLKNEYFDHNSRKFGIKYLGYEDFNHLSTFLPLDYDENLSELLQYDKSLIIKKISDVTFNNLEKYFENNFINEFNNHQQKFLNKHVSLVEKYYNDHGVSYIGYGYTKENTSLEEMKVLNEEFLDETEILSEIHNIKKMSDKNLFFELEKYNINQEIYQKFSLQQEKLNDIFFDEIDETYYEWNKKNVVHFFKTTGQIIKNFFPNIDQLKNLKNNIKGKIVKVFTNNFSNFKKEQEEILEEIKSTKNNSELMKISDQIIATENSVIEDIEFPWSNFVPRNLKNYHSSYFRIKEKNQQIDSYFGLSLFGIKGLIYSANNNQNKGLFYFSFLHKTFLSDDILFSDRNNKIEFITNDQKYQITLNFVPFKRDDLENQELKKVIELPDIKNLNLQIKNLQDQTTNTYLVKNLKYSTSLDDKKVIVDSFGIVEDKNNPDKVKNFILFDLLNNKKNIFIASNHTFNKNALKLENIDEKLFVGSWKNFFEQNNFFSYNFLDPVDYFANSSFLEKDKNKKLFYATIFFLIIIMSSVFLISGNKIWKEVNKRLTYLKNQKNNKK